MTNWATEGESLAGAVKYKAGGTKCPACDSPNTMRKNSIVALVLIVITFAQMLFFVALGNVVALCGWLLLPPACIYALYCFIYAPDYHCPRCRLIFKTKPRRFFT